MQNFTFSLEPDPDDPEFQSIYLSNGQGASAEICGRIGSPTFAKVVLESLQAMNQQSVKDMFILS